MVSSASSLNSEDSLVSGLFAPGAATALRPFFACYKHNPLNCNPDKIKILIDENRCSCIPDRVGTNLSLINRRNGIKLIIN